MWLKSLVQDILPPGDRDESRFSLDFEVLLTGLEIKVARDPSMHREISRIGVPDGYRRGWMDLRG
jgi:hypothetical protein